MANSLLDFVMSLVRDPAAAAQYAADPAQALAAADLTDVTSADVDNLIPMVSDSLSMAAPTPGAQTFDVDPASNVWASGAATSAFDAFADHVPTPDDGGAVPVISDPIDQPDQIAQPGIDVLHDAGITAEPTWTEPSVQFDAPFVDSGPAPVDDFGADWGQSLADTQPGQDDPGFDLFN